MTISLRVYTFAERCFGARAVCLYIVRRFTSDFSSGRNGNYIIYILDYRRMGRGFSTVSESHRPIEMQLLHSQIEILALCSGALFSQRRFLENLKSLSQPFMEPEDSLPYTQQHATDPYPEADESSSQPPTLSMKIRLNIILPSTPRSSTWYFPFRIYDQDLVCISRLPHASYMPRPSCPASPKIFYWIYIVCFFNTVKPCPSVCSQVSFLKLVNIFVLNIAWESTVKATERI
jgi:hypothetical protein